MNNKKEILKYLSDNKSTLKKEFRIIKIGLFGSNAAELNSGLSDIDLVIEFEPDTKMLFEKKKLVKEL
jgi:predicted nucleotidyltransferase